MKFITQENGTEITVELTIVDDVNDGDQNEDWVGNVEASDGTMMQVKGSKEHIKDEFEKLEQLASERGWAFVRTGQIPEKRLPT